MIQFPGFSMSMTALAVHIGQITALTFAPAPDVTPLAAHLEAEPIVFQQPAPREDGASRSTGAGAK